MHSRQPLQGSSDSLQSLLLTQGTLSIRRGPNGRVELPEVVPTLIERQGRIEFERPELDSAS